MNESGRFPADITLAVDGDGVIRKAVPSQALSDEPLDDWLGQRWIETVLTGATGPVENAVDLGRREGESSSFVVNQRLPSGREILLEYTTVKLPSGSGFIAIGKNFQAISDLRTRLAAVQLEREQDYWKLREVETRYRALLDAASEAVALVRVGTLRVVESNALAAKAFGLVPGAEFFPDLPERDRKALDGLLETARMTGRAPRIVLHHAADAPLSLRASTLTSEAGTFYLLQVSRLTDSGFETASSGEPPAWSLESLVRRLPQAFLVVDRNGVVRSANHAFLDLVQAEFETAVLGKSANRWLSLPGGGLRRILDRIEQRGVVQSMRATVMGERGGTAEVDIFAAGDRDDRPNAFALIVREALADAAAGASPPDPSGSSLGKAVRSSVEAIERQRLSEALARSGGNRTLAAESLGISRQSLHAKLRKYAL
ncbi:transcriptional regulator PpsR [Roseiarcus fermentans]|uniref:Transcriptional regulator PpsR n=1 Tax=Roseiarcus fermentans TaxID=1473586 RepID=A0A366F0L3_9HYPH|nr:transcriptional regulator PpsR [Roseiarcus fermentans]RBP08181.1 transcriptional regulator PpsR [Roseiarcus fermentans]